MINIHPIGNITTSNSKAVEDGRSSGSNYATITRGGEEVLVNTLDYNTRSDCGKLHWLSLLLQLFKLYL